MSCFQNIRGLLPASMIDWPGRICSVLFLGGCNFRCPYCHNPELVECASDEEVLEWSEIARFLGQRAGWIDGVSVTGGEPTIHADLPELLYRIREAGFAVKLDTNGSRPRALRALLEAGLVDHVAMDLKTSLEKYPSLVGRPVDPRRIAESVEIILSSGVKHEFRCTVVPEWVDFRDLLSLARLIGETGNLVLQQFRPHNTLDPMLTEVRPYPDRMLLRWAELLSETVPTSTRGLLSMEPREERRSPTPSFR